MLNLKPAVFLDRDGVLNQLVLDPLSGKFESPYSPDQVVLVEGAIDALKKLDAAGFELIVVSNQPSAAKKTVTQAQLLEVHNRFADLIDRTGDLISDYRYCYHHPEGLDPELGQTCNCRKPEPGMLTAASDDLHIDLDSSWIVGDSDVDIEAGQRAGCMTILIENPDSAHRRSVQGPTPTFTVTTIDEAVERVIG